MLVYKNVPFNALIDKAKLMSKTQTTFDEDIDLLELFLILWRGKWILIIFIIISVLIGSTFLLLKDSRYVEKVPFYESKLIYSLDTLPPLNSYEDKQVLLDFKKIFNSKDTFEDWKKNNSQSQVNLEDFINTKIFNGINVSKNESERLTSFNYKDGNYNIIIRTKNTSLIDEIFDYANFASEVLNLQYISKVNNEYELIKKYFKDFNDNYPKRANPGFISKLLSSSRYVSAIEEGSNTLNIERPTLPINLNAPPPKNFNYLKVFVFIILGGMIGAFVVFIVNVMQKRKVNL